MPFTPNHSLVRPLLSVPLGLSAVAVVCVACGSDKSSSTASVDAGGQQDAAVAALSSSTGETSDIVFGVGDPVAVPSTTTEGSTTDDTAAPVNEPPLQSCNDARGGTGDPMIDNFEDPMYSENYGYAIPTQDGREANWYTYDDLTDGQTTFGLETTVGPTGKMTSAAHTTGSGYFEWGQGFGTGLRWGALDSNGEFINCMYDASAYQGFSFWMSGTSGTVRLKVNTADVIAKSAGGTCDEAAGEACWDDHGKELTLSETWTHYVVPFDSLKQAGWGKNVGAFDPTRLRVVQFQTGADATFDYWLDDLSFYPDLRPATDSGVVDGGLNEAGTVEAGLGDPETSEAGPASIDGGIEGVTESPDAQLSLDAGDEGPTVEPDAGSDAGLADASQ